MIMSRLKYLIKRWPFEIGLILLLLTVGLLAWQDAGSVISVGQLTVAVALLVLVQFVFHRRARIERSAEAEELVKTVGKRLDHHYAQVQSYVSLMRTIKPRKALPVMRGWAASPDFINLVLSHVQDNRPKVILELGSGVSTICLAYFLKDLGMGHVFSVDHQQVEILESSNRNQSAYKHYSINLWGCNGVSSKSDL